MQTSDALGAAAAQLGPDAQAAVVEFNKQAGMSHGKISRVFQTLFGIRLSRGGSTHVVLRAARRCEPVYASICQTVQASPWTVLDETGWHVGGQNAWLHGIVGENATAYVVDPTRSGAVAERVLGLDYAGVMIHDGWSPYDHFQNAQHQQCLGHLLRRSQELLETATRGAVRFPRRIRELLSHALDLRDRHAAGQLSDHGLAVCRGRLDSALYEAIYPAKTNAANERFAQHLWNHHHELLTFLNVPRLDATNWRAELAMRFGVILRKVWGGNRTWTGARAQSVLMSVWRTCWQRGQNAVTFLSQLLRRCRPQLVGVPP
jgi:transposase